MKFKVALAQFPGGGVSRWETNAWIIKTVRQMDQDASISEVVSLSYADTPITMTRNRAILEAKQAKCDYLLCIDSDMRPDLGEKPFWETAWGFMRARRGEEGSTFVTYDDGKGRPAPEMVPPATIAAPYCGPPPGECVYVFHWATGETDSPNPSFKLEMIPREMAAIKAGIEEVAALPTGLILYDMRVFDALPPPWFRYEWADGNEAEKATTEDVYQTRNASLLGLPQFCAWDCWAGHVKTKTVVRPVIIGRDQVHQSLREAVLRGVDAGDRLIVMGGDNGRHEPARALPVAPRAEVPVDDRI